MSKKNIVHTDHYKTRGRLRQSAPKLHERHKQRLIAKQKQLRKKTGKR